MIIRRRMRPTCSPAPLLSVFNLRFLNYWSFYQFPPTKLKFTKLYQVLKRITCHITSYQHFTKSVLSGGLFKTSPVTAVTSTYTPSAAAATGATPLFVPIATDEYYSSCHIRFVLFCFCSVYPDDSIVILLFTLRNTNKQTNKQLWNLRNFLYNKQ